MAKSIAQLRRDKRIDEIIDDDGESWFVELKPGWSFGGESHCSGFESVKEINECLWEIQPCSCEECRP